MALRVAQRGERGDGGGRRDEECDAADAIEVTASAADSRESAPRTHSPSGSDSWLATRPIRVGEATINEEAALTL